jgi:hypothetical protein
MAHREGKGAISRLSKILREAGWSDIGWEPQQWSRTSRVSLGRFHSVGRRAGFPVQRADRRSRAKRLSLYGGASRQTKLHEVGTVDSICGTSQSFTSQVDHGFLATIRRCVSIRGHSVFCSSISARSLTVAITSDDSSARSSGKFHIPNASMSFLAIR